MKRRRDQSDFTEKALSEKFKQISEEFSPPLGLEYEILRRFEREKLSTTNNFFTGIRFIIQPN